MRAYASGAVLPSPDAPVEQQSFKGWNVQYERYRVSVDQYISFYRDGYLIVRNLVPKEDVDELIQHTEDLMAGRVVIPGVPPPPEGISPQERAQYYLRIHMLHRALEIHERYFLHPRILDVVQALVGPDVLALQTMLFIKGPGKVGQGYHQDSYYIPTSPDTLIGAWLALDRADEENGCLWISPGSQHEPVYPPTSRPDLADELEGLTTVEGVSIPDESLNDLTRIVKKYEGREIAAVLDPGDVVFFGGHVLHWSHSNRSKDRFRRSFVCHYCNARSYTEWGGGNAAHILARGDTHLPFAKPRFGTPCAALLSPEERKRRAPANSSMMGGPDGMMDMMPHGDDDHDDGGEM